VFHVAAAAEPVPSAAERKGSLHRHLRSAGDPGRQIDNTYSDVVAKPMKTSRLRPRNTVTRALDGFAEHREAPLQRQTVQERDTLGRVVVELRGHWVKVGGTTR
jgi:hypothetical protein